MSVLYEGFTFTSYVYAEDPKPVTDSKLTPDGNAWSLRLDKNAVYQINMSDLYQTPVYNSKKNSIAFVDENGTVYARGSGKTIISTKINGKVIKIKVNISD